MDVLDGMGLERKGLVKGRQCCRAVNFTLDWTGGGERVRLKSNETTQWKWKTSKSVSAAMIART